MAVAALLAFNRSPVQSVPIAWAGSNTGCWDEALNWVFGLPSFADSLALGANDTEFRSGYGGAESTFINAGTLSLGGGLANFSGTTLSGGRYLVAGASVMQFAGADIGTNAATIRLSGAGSSLRDSINGNDALANFAGNTAAGSFTRENGRNFNAAGAFDNAGVVHVGSASSFVAAGSFANAVGAQLQLAGGSFVGPDLGNAGAVSGFGSVGPALDNSGSMTAAGGTLGSFDSVIVLSTNASDAAGLALGNIELRRHGTVTAVPEPGTWLRMVGGLALMARVARRRVQAAA